MHVVILNYYYDGALLTPAALLERYFLLTGWVDGLEQAGARVSVLQRFHKSATVERANVCYHFVADGFGPRLRKWQLPLGMTQLAGSLARTSRAAGVPTVVHVNGLLFPLQTRLLRRWIPDGCALVVQHHAEQPWRGWRHPVQRWGLAAADAFLFTNRELAQEWITAGTIAATAPIHAVMEGSSALAYQPRGAARAATGLVGEPVVLWTGNLTPNKDPLTVLDGFEHVLAHRPHARFYMAYQRTDLLSEVEQRIARSPALGGAVTQLGAIPYGQIGAYYNSADLFVQGSHREGSGIALLDALACGVVPVVTDISAFRTVTDDGRIGALWPVGQAAACANALLGLLEQPLEPLAQEARRFFLERWSFAAIGRQAVTACGEILERATIPEVSR